MTKQVNDAEIRMQNDLIALVAGTLKGPDFERVASAVANDPALQLELEHLEMIHASVLRNAEPADDAAAVAATTSRVLRDISNAAPTPAPKAFAVAWLRDLTVWLHTTWVSICQPDRARWAYGAVAIQAVVIVALVTNALPWKPEETSAMRGGPGPTDAKQLGGARYRAFLSQLFGRYARVHVESIAAGHSRPDRFRPEPAGPVPDQCGT